MGKWSMLADDNAHLRKEESLRESLTQERRAVKDLVDENGLLRLELSELKTAKLQTQGSQIPLPGEFDVVRQFLSEPVALPLTFRVGVTDSLDPAPRASVTSQEVQENVGWQAGPLEGFSTDYTPSFSP